MTPEEVAKIEKYTKHKNMALAAKKKQVCAFDLGLIE
jgi:hypothetical protein